MDIEDINEMVVMLKAHIEDYKSARIKWAFDEVMKLKIGPKLKYRLPQTCHKSDVEKIKSAIIEDGEYIDTIHDHGNDYYISKNPTHRINQSLIEANASLVEANKSSVIANDSLISTNDSVVTTNASVRLTNNSVGSLNYFQKWVLGISVFIAAITTVFVILTYLEQNKDTNQQQLKELEEEARTQSQILQSIRLSLNELADSIAVLKIDSLSVRVK